MFLQALIQKAKADPSLGLFVDNYGPFCSLLKLIAAVVFAVFLLYVTNQDSFIL